MYKIRTMVQNAEKLKQKYQLSRYSQDELPQLINILKGEMSFVGPRPLPLNEASQIPPKYNQRYTVLPGITSTWVTKGSHNLSFSKWMEEDIIYIKKQGIMYDLLIILKTIGLVLKLP